LYLGLGEFGEGKTMGLAAYGEPTLLWPAVSRLLDTSDPSRWYRYLQEPSESLLGFPPRSDDEATNGPYPHFAAAVQRRLEQAIKRVAESACEQAGCAALCLAGGVALNCSANGGLLVDRHPHPVWAFAAAGDGGLSLGAALLAAQEAGELESRRLDHAYLGPSFDNRAIELALQAEPGITIHRSARVVEEVAERLSRGQIVGWFHGRMELGPRALGNRSILADPRSAHVRDRVNRLKGREPWRPLAPSVIADRASEYFELPGESPFMLFAARVRPSARDQLPAVVHADGSARPQTVRQAQNTALHALLLQFERRPGLPVLLNTSFNTAGEPIVCRPEDGIRTFLATGLDALACGDFIAEPAWSRPHP
jgi:carbamoyltransferase